MTVLRQFPALLVCAAACAFAQPHLEIGALPSSWITGGPNCLEVPDWQVQQYNSTFLILRESGCTHYEKPFLYLIFGKERALLVDTGAGESDVAQFIKKLMRSSVALVVAHSHGHGDHVAGDNGFAGMPNVTMI